MWRNGQRSSKRNNLCGADTHVRAVVIASDAGSKPAAEAQSMWFSPNLMSSVVKAFSGGVFVSVVKETWR
jgi:hypothetical protein